MVHVFVLFVLLDGEVVSQDMAWRDINLCSQYARMVVNSKHELSRLHAPRAVSIAAYCIPRKVSENDTDLIIY